MPKFGFGNKPRMTGFTRMGKEDKTKTEIKPLMDADSR
jgi:hypothetical protein